MIELIIGKWLNTSFDVIVWESYRKASYASDIIRWGNLSPQSFLKRKLSCKSILLAEKKEKSTNHNEEGVHFLWNHSTFIGFLFIIDLFFTIVMKAREEQFKG